MSANARFQGAESGPSVALRGILKAPTGVFRTRASATPGQSTWVLHPGNDTDEEKENKEPYTPPAAPCRTRPGEPFGDRRTELTERRLGELRVASSPGVESGPGVTLRGILKDCTRRFTTWAPPGLSKLVLHQGKARGDSGTDEEKERTEPAHPRVHFRKPLAQFRQVSMSRDANRARKSHWKKKARTETDPSADRYT